MNSSNSEKNNQEQFTLVLEAPPSPELPGKDMGTLLTDASIISLTSKIMITESMLNLITRNLTFNEFMREMLIAIMKVFKCEAGSIFELDQKDNILFFRSVSGSGSDRLPRFVVPVGQGIVGHVAESRQPLVENNVKANKIYLKAIEKAVEFEAKNLIAVPILIRGNLYGVLELLNRYGDEQFSEEDTDLLTYACEMAGKTIEARMILSWALQKNAIRDAA